MNFRSSRGARAVTSRSRFAAVALMAAPLILSAPASAEDDKTMVTIDGYTITAKDVAMTKQLVGPMLQRLPEAQRNPFIIKFMTEAYLLASAARNAKLHDTPEFKRRMKLAEIRQLRDMYIRTQIDAELTDDVVKKRYDEVVGKIKPEEEVKARHILVKTEDEAKAIIVALDKGGDFAALAKEKSTGPSGANGGLLGFFGKGKMVPPFEAAAFALKAGEHSKAPVQTQFGYHIIKVEERRAKAAPSFDKVKEQLRGAMQKEALAKLLADLTSKAKIE